MVWDGAMGTMLQASGLSLDGGPERWNIEAPEVVEAIHRAYLDAGAEVLTTNTFGANPIRWRDYESPHAWEAVNRAGVTLARQARQGVQRPVRIVGGMGPTGQRLAPQGNVTHAAVQAAYQQQATVLLQAGVDCLLIETMITMAELKAALQGAQQARRQITQQEEGILRHVPLYCTVTVSEEGNLFDGTTAEMVADRVTQWGADAVGVNCSYGPDHLVSVVARMRQVTDLPILVQPNAGMPTREGDMVHHPVTPAEMAVYASQFHAAGATCMGGCCGTTPAHIAAMVDALKEC